MPEFPEVEALRRALDEAVRASPVEKAGPAHVATLKTFQPPLQELEGRRFEGAERRGKNLLFPTDDGELVLHIHLMSAGRLRHLGFGEKQPKTPAFRLTFEDGSSLVLTEGGPKKRAKVGVYTPDAIDAELAHIGPEAYRLGKEWLAEILAADSRRLHAFLRDQRALAGIGRAWANEILLTARLSPYALTTELSDEEVERLSGAIDSDLQRGLELRERGASDKKAYRIHDRLGEPCPNCGTPIARVYFDEHTIYYCPSCQTEGRILKDRRLSRLLR
jgi:formamidopyrimidine-DNA glycosylase